MTAPVAPGTLDRITRRARLMQPYARRHPLDAGQAPTPGHRGMWRIGPSHTAMGFVATERCGCLGETPLWHASVSVWSIITQAKVPEPGIARQVAEALLTGVGQDRALWWWDEEAKVGHLRAHMTDAEAQGVPPSEAGPEGHDEPGEWYDRTGAVAHG